LVNRPFLALYSGPPALQAKALAGKQTRLWGNDLILPHSSEKVNVRKTGTNFAQGAPQSAQKAAQTKRP